MATILPRYISVTNQKGGVGKTTTSVNLAAGLAYLGFKTLLIDLDPQGNASSGLGIDRHTASTIYDVLIGQKDILETIQTTPLDNLMVIPANPNLIGAEVELINAISREKKLKVALKKLPADYSFVVFDCPPSLGLLTINAFTASHSILIPTQCEYYALEGLGQLMTTYQIVKEDLNENLEIEGVVLTMFDPRNKLTHEVVKELESHFPEKLFKARIPRNVKLSESPSFGKPIVLYDPESKGCAAYFQLAKEVLDKWNLFTDAHAQRMNAAMHPEEAKEVENEPAAQPEVEVIVEKQETREEVATEVVAVVTEEISQPAVEVAAETVNEVNLETPATEAPTEETSAGL